jgi:hypothetical protein
MENLNTQDQLIKIFRIQITFFVLHVIFLASIAYVLLTGPSTYNVGHEILYKWEAVSLLILTYTTFSLFHWLQKWLTNDWRIPFNARLNILGLDTMRKDIDHITKNMEKLRLMQSSLENMIDKHELTLCEKDLSEPAEIRIRNSVAETKAAAKNLDECLPILKGVALSAKSMLGESDLCKTATVYDYVFGKRIGGFINRLIYKIDYA